MSFNRVTVTLIALAAVLLIGVVSFLGNGSDAEPADDPTPTASAPPSPTASPAPSPDPVTAPLTGVATDDEAVTQRPVLAVKVENSAAARPQSGLDVADVVYEELTEGGITRFIALFQSVVPEVVGPVRSGREVDAEVLPAYRPLLAYSGARPDVNALLRGAGLALLPDDGTGHPFYREGSRKAPHNLYAGGQDLYDAGAADLPPAAASWGFDDEPPSGAVACPADDTACEDPGSALDVRMSGVSRTGWRYDEAAGVYRRLQDGQAHTVTGPGTIGAANVLVLLTDVDASGCCDPAGNPLTSTRVVGQGTGVALRDGQRYDIVWRKAAAGSPYQIALADGRAFAFRPGPTWVLLAPKDALG